MSNTFELNNVKVCWSTLMTKDETLHKKKWGKDLKVLIFEDTPEYEMLTGVIEENIPKAKELVNKAVNDAINQRNANKAEGEELEKPIIVRKPVSPLKESSKVENAYELSFKFYHYIKEEDEDIGKLVLNRKVYRSEEDLPIFYTRDKNTGEKVYETSNGKKWVPMSDNIINCKLALVTGYNAKDKTACLYFKLLEGEIVSSDFGKKSSGSNSYDNTYFVLGNDEDTVVDTQPAPKTTKAKSKTKAVEVNVEEFDTIDV